MAGRVASVAAGQSDGRTYASVGFVRIAQLIPVDQEVLTVPIGTSAGAALELMAEHEFDQLPVVNRRGRVIGTFTHRSFANQLRFLRRQDDPRMAFVDDLVEPLRFVPLADSLQDTLRWIDKDNAVLVGDEQLLLAIVTAADVSRFLWQRTRPFVLVQEIELATRELMRSACSGAQLAQCVVAALPDEDGHRSSAQLDELTMRELHSVLLNKTSYGRHFRGTFGQSRELVQSTLEPVSEIRNKIVHFRGTVSEDEVNTLLRASAWLRHRTMIAEEA
ncbi:CBS domain-containing protein [Kribbella sp. NPDC050241]|uniref:CBS domain-containing protein n=1 Tax=Kribbella sp. NPDC050241 TaxID=3364115 RepID=UPI00379EBB3D